MTMERDEKDREKVRDRDRGREKDRDREKEKDRDREKEKERDREKEKMKSKEKDREGEKKKDRGKESEKERSHDKEKTHDKERDSESRKDADREKERGRDQERDRKKEREKGAKEKKKEKEHSKKDRDKETDKEKDRDKIREREREREKDREKIGDREERETEREKDRGKDREREKERDKEKEREREKERDKEKEREREKERDKEKEREREKERDKEKEREREKERDRERDKEREREREKDRQKLRLKERDRDHDREKDRDYERRRDKDWEERLRETEKEKDHEFEKEKKRDEKEKLSKEPQRSQTSTAVLEERIVKMREERQRANANQRFSAKNGDADNDVHAWVNKSRKLAQQKSLDDKQKAARMAKILSEQDNEDDDDNSDEFQRSGYGGEELAGLKVKHGLEKVMEGHAIVLTLKDASVLDGDDVNAEVDELENIEMSEQQAREDAYKAAKKRPGVYEDKFNNDIDALEKRTILPQYDDIATDEGLILDESGGFTMEHRKKLDEALQKLEGSSVKESLSGSVSNLPSDYFTEEDMLQFKKPKKKKKLRKKEKFDIDALEAEAVAAGLGAGDLGARDSESRTAQKQAVEKAEADARKNAYQNALNKAEDASRALREDTTAKPMEVEDPQVFTVGGEDEDDLYKSLERARQAALKKQKDSGSSGAGAQSVLARLAALGQETVASSQRPIRAEGQEENLVFTDTGEFCRSLQLDDAIIRRAGPKDVFAEDDEDTPMVDSEVEDVSKVAGGWTEVVEVDKNHSVGEGESDREDAGEEPITEVSVGKGLAGALNLLKERGTLKETVDWGGRNMDKKRSKLVGIVDESNNKVGQRDILLDRLDEFGRTMTPKEAFRKLSHKFHGKGPGKMKQEKKQKQFQEELRLKQMNSGDTPLMSMEKMRDAQARMHTPYIVISGHIKPGQTSDPRSGFATVEKEPVGSLTPMLGDKGVGSLTPMLGDKKVEHFLGIKRKAEPGSMGPPPPKQPKLDR